MPGAVIFPLKRRRSLFIPQALPQPFVSCCNFCAPQCRWVGGGGHLAIIPRGGGGTVFPQGGDNKGGIGPLQLMAGKTSQLQCNAHMGHARNQTTPTMLTCLAV